MNETKSKFEKLGTILRTSLVAELTTSVVRVIDRSRLSVAGMAPAISVSHTRDHVLIDILKSGSYTTAACDP